MIAGFDEASNSKGCVDSCLKEKSVLSGKERFEKLEEMDARARGGGCK
jgi:hypothetical protein